MQYESAEAQLVASWLHIQKVLAGIQLPAILNAFFSRVFTRLQQTKTGMLPSNYTLTDSSQTFYLQAHPGLNQRYLNTMISINSTQINSIREMVTVYDITTVKI